MNRLLALLLALAVTLPAFADPQAALDVMETGIPLIVQVPGRFAWLDDDTLAVTTYADANAKVPWMVRRIVAYDVASHASRTLVPRGFLNCTNAGYRLVSLDVGDLESRFAVASRAAPSMQQFQLWDPATHTLAPAPAEFKAGWHPAACLKPAPEDLPLHDLLGSRKPVRYLQPEHGSLMWAMLDASGHPMGPTLVTPKKTLPVAAHINDVSHEVAWLPFRKAYQLSAGVHDRMQDPPRDTPLVTMDVDGRVTRQAIPASLTRQLDALGASAPAEMIATRAGGLVIQPGLPANGGGLYLVQGERGRRVWCSAGQASCAMSQAPAVSPDGCHVAFDARPAVAVPNGYPDAPTLKVLSLCDVDLPAEPTAAGHRRKAR